MCEREEHAAARWPGRSGAAAAASLRWGPERGKAPVHTLELTLWGFSGPRPRLHDDSPLARLPGMGNERDPARGVGVRGTPESSISLPERG